ncbi:transcriptional regulator [Jatrophihabitans fulvus]
MTITVVVADDQEMVRAGFAALLAAEDDIEVVGQAADGEQAVAVCTELQPDVVLMDVRMPVLDGIGALRRLTARGLPTRVVVLTTFDLDEYVYDALRAGASGFLLKHLPPRELAAAVRTVAAGESLLAPSVTTRLVESYLRRPPVRADAGLPEPLTPRETEVLALVATGRSNAEIAAALVLAEQTVKSHVSRVFTKLGVRDRAQAVVWAYEHGLAGRGSSSPL